MAPLHNGEKSKAGRHTTGKLMLVDLAGSERVKKTGAEGRGLDSSSFQLSLSRFCYEIHPKYPLNTPDTAYTPPKQPLHATPIPQKALTFSRKVERCKPLAEGMTEKEAQAINKSLTALGRCIQMLAQGGGRGLHSFTFQLNLGRFGHTPPCPPV